MRVACSAHRRAANAAGDAISFDVAIDISNDLDEDGLGSDSGLASSDHAAPNAAHTHAAAMFERSDPPSSHSAPHTIPRLCELDMSN